MPELVQGTVEVILTQTINGDGMKIEWISVMREDWWRSTLRDKDLRSADHLHPHSGRRSSFQQVSAIRPI